MFDLIMFFFIMIKRIISKIYKENLLKKFRHIGFGFLFDPLSKIYTPELISIGDNVFIGEGAYISAEVYIGNNVMFGPNVTILSGNHYFGIEGKSVRFLKPVNRNNSSPIKIEDEVWCGANVLILDGVTIGQGSVIGAGSVVSKKIPPFVVAVGNYCKPIAKIFDDKTLYRHLLSLGYKDEFINRCIEQRSSELVDLGLSDIKIINKTEKIREYIYKK